MNYAALGAIAMAVAVALGAFGAHGLRERLDAYSLGIWEKAVFYHFIHAIGMLLAQGKQQGDRASLLFLAGILFLAGAVMSYRKRFSILGMLSGVFLAGLAGVIPMYYQAPENHQIYLNVGHVHNLTDPQDI